MLDSLVFCYCLSNKTGMVQTFESIFLLRRILENFPKNLSFSCHVAESWGKLYSELQEFHFWDNFMRFHHF